MIAKTQQIITRDVFECTVCEMKFDNIADAEKHHFCEHTRHAIPRKELDLPMYGTLYKFDDEKTFRQFSDFVLKDTRQTWHGSGWYRHEIDESDEEEREFLFPLSDDVESCHRAIVDLTNRTEIIQKFLDNNR
jgi:hypothetical protein